MRHAPPHVARPTGVLGAVGAAATLLLAGCATDTPATTDAAEEETPHGYVEGAEETSEPQWRLLLADTTTGDVHLLDPLTEEATALAEVPGVREATTDGRFAYLGTGTSAAVVDTGAWTVDHGDHVHYYRTQPADLGQVAAGDGLRVAGDVAVTALTSTDGVRVLDRGALEDDGEIRETATADGAVALALGGRLLLAGTAGTDTVQVLGRDGEPTDTDLDADCPDPAGQADTRRGAVLGCADGALVVGEDDDTLTADRIPYPDGADPVHTFDHRPTAAVLAGRTDDGEVWVLDLAAEQWVPVDTPQPAVAASAAGEDLPVLVLGDDGTLRSHDPATGEQLAETTLLDDPPDGATPPRIWIDTTRAYVNDPAARAVYEIDYRDDLRLARTFDVDLTPDLMVETGW